MAENKKKAIADPAFGYPGNDLYQN